MNVKNPVSLRRSRAAKEAHARRKAAFAEPSGSVQSVIDVEVRVHPVPYSGTHRALGGINNGEGIRDNKAIAAALRKIANELDALNNKVSEDAGRKE